jgi:hypothetical protein
MWNWTGVLSHMKVSSEATEVSNKEANVLIKFNWAIHTSTVW